MSYKTREPLSSQTLQKMIVKHFPKQKISSIHEVSQSFVNRVYFFRLNNGAEFFLKINNPLWSFKQKRELEAIALVKEKTTVPVPTIRAISPPDEPLTYMIMEKAPGRELGSALRSAQWSKTAFLDVIKDVGGYLGELQKVSFDFYGDFSAPSLSPSKVPSTLWGQQFSAFSECLNAFCFQVLNWVDTESFPKIRKRLIKIIPRYLETIEDHSPACLVHSDIQPSNIIVEGKKITAIIDFEWAFAGTSNLDFHLTKAGFCFSSFPSLASDSSFSAFFQVSEEELTHALMTGYSARSSKPIVPYPDNFGEFIWLLYIIGSWRWITESSTPQEIDQLKDGVYSLFRQLF